MCSSVAAEQAFSFRNPFNPEQCGRACRAGQRLLAADNTHPRGQLLLAEGLLCEGLADDPWALDAAIALFRRIVTNDSSNFFAELEFADALRKRFPLADEAQAALAHAWLSLETADIGFARQDLTEYLAENLDALADYRRRISPVLEKLTKRDREGTLLRAEVVGFIDVLVLTGPAGVVRAELALQRHLGTPQDSDLRMLYMTEVLRGQLELPASRAAYAEVEPGLCRRDAPTSAAECLLARSRLGELDEKERSGWLEEAIAAAETDLGRSE